mmetsp:Transcript_15794/g.34560  ORF Transcript_15794/g.34560 Transcript_15794/m.34560 type:complete len:216 (-) Transcript_15794:9-656(-)
MAGCVHDGILAGCRAIEEQPQAEALAMSANLANTLRDLRDVLRDRFRGVSDRSREVGEVAMDDVHVGEVSLRQLRGVQRLDAVSHVGSAPHRADLALGAPAVLQRLLEIVAALAQEQHVGLLDSEGLARGSLQALHELVHLLGPVLLRPIRKGLHVGEGVHEPANLAKIVILEGRNQPFGLISHAGNSKLEVGLECGLSTTKPKKQSLGWKLGTA